MLTIRPVELSELETLLTFAERTFRTAFQALNDPFHFENYCHRMFTKENFLRQMQHPESEFWFGIEQEKPVAYLKLNFDQTHPEMDGLRAVHVERLYVDPERQGRRIGEKMLEHARSRAASLGLEWVWLSVWQKTPNAVRFYERCGFEKFGTEVFWVADDPQMDWVMRKHV